MNEKEMEDTIKEANRLAEKKKAELLEDFPDIEKIMWKMTENLVPIAVNHSLEDVIYKSLCVGATIISQKYRAAQRVERELMDSCKSNVKH